MTDLIFPLNEGLGTQKEGGDQAEAGEFWDTLPDFRPDFDDYESDVTRVRKLSSEGIKSCNIAISNA